MRIRLMLLAHLSLYITIFICIVYRILNRPNIGLEVRKIPPALQPQKVKEVQEIPPRIERQSVTLEDKNSTYHLNYSQYLLEFPYLQSYRCSLLLVPPTDQIQEITEPLLLLAIKSHPQATERRNALRQTWFREVVVEGYRVKPIFLLAQSDHIQDMNLAQRESMEYEDIIQWDFNEGHHNLSLKERCFLEWLNFNLPHVDFIFKGDDDEFVNPPVLVEYIGEYGTPHTLHGSVQHKARVFRGGKYQVSETLLSNSNYPDFLSGGGFIFPGPSVGLLYQASQELPVFPLDDVYFGFLALAANLTYRNDERFYVFGHDFNACTFQRALVVHGVKMEKLINLWPVVQGAKCGKSTVT
ncbi:beta-1,3-galactosyltransferase 5-like [Hyperolius riggenbachi]|uniref:beta-1,3-galactosyltransferase 5-like n=1 Tax=Hyperolius riggenbachi TaxID=752182 RepID=UPI0035A2ECBF